MVYPIGKIFIPAIYNLWVSEISGLENLPTEKSFIVASNHSSYYDALLPYTVLIPILNRQMHALVNSRYWDSYLFRTILEWGKCIPVYVGKDRESYKTNNKSFSKAIYFLKEGHIVAIFPEGTRSHDGKLKKAFTGVAKLALATKYPVVPFGVIGSHKIMPKGSALPRFKRCRVKIGKPIYFKTMKPTKANFEKTTRIVMKEIAKLIGQKYNF